MTRSPALLAALLAIGCGDTRSETVALPPLVRPTAPTPVTSVTISGSVLDHASGRAVADVVVVLRGESGQVTTRTNDRGQFSLTTAPGRYRVFVRGDGVLSVGLTDLPRLEGPPRQALAGELDESLAPVLDARADLEGIELSVTPAATLTGTVLDPDRRPLAGAVVRLVPVDRFATWLSNVRPVLGTDITTTHADGRFALHVPPGTYLLDATHAELAGVGGTTRGTEIGLSAQHPHDIQVELAPGCIVSGRVVRHDGSPAPDGAIERFGAGRDGFGPAGRIEAGEFRWVTTEEQTVTLRAWPWRSPPSPAQTFECKDGRRFTDVVFRLPKKWPDISGMIVDADDVPVPFAYVDIQPLDAFVGGQQERTDANGSWHVYDMLPGRYRVTATAPGRGIADMVIAAPRHDLRLALGGTGRIVGTTTDLATGSVQVSFLHCGRKDNPLLVAPEPRIVPVVSGRFVIERAPACTLALAVRWRDRIVEVVTAVEPERTSYIEVDIGEPRAKTVTGVVRDTSGRAVEGARVTAVLRDREPVSTRTDANGRFTLETRAGAQLVAGKGDHVGRALVGRANVASERVDVILDGVDLDQ